MEDRKDIMSTYLRRLIFAIAITLLFLMACAMCSCRTIKYIPVERTTFKTDTEYQSIWHTDSVIDRDTVTITKEGKEIVKWRIRTREVHDTLYYAKHDTIIVEKPYPLEKTLSRWEKAKKDLSGFSIIGILLIALISLICLLRFCCSHKKKKEL